MIAQTPVEVAVGVVLRPDGAFLLAQRPPGKPMEGYWEFPGGKVEQGEDVRSALCREFLEELGLRIEAASRWAVREFTYPHARVRLHFWRIFGWQGVPQSLEGQALRWERIDNPLVEPWLPGALPLRRWLQLPDHYAISGATQLGNAEFLARLDRAAGSGEIRLLQLREKGLSGSAFDALFREVWARARSFGFKLLVNSDHPEHYWHDAHGVHLTHAALLARESRPDVQWCAASCHDGHALRRAGAIGADFAVLGPVCATASHPGMAALGWKGFFEHSRETPLPVYALGGLERSDLALARQWGAQGVASLRASWRNE
jgi:8-oxo-dGTP diphosphatase